MAQDLETPDSIRGKLSVRMARAAEDIEAAQRLRYKVFYQEMTARADADTLASGLDRDRFDAICDHLLVVRNVHPGGGGIVVDGGELVGTYRLLRQETADAQGGFYTASEFDIAPMIARNPKARFLELGRSCVLKEYRSKPVVEMLWQGIWNYVRESRSDVMFGCASLEGSDPSQHADALSYLAHYAQAPAQWRVKAVEDRLVRMDIKNKDAIDQKQALKALPPLIKGYLRLGCFIGDGAVIDQQFNTTDVLIMLPVSAINPRYFERFGKPIQSSD